MKPKILIVDDEKDNLNALRRLLRNDFEVFSAENGKDALELVRTHKDLDVLVSDQRMPGMTGSEFFQEVQTFCPKPTRILLTGFADLEAVIEAVNKGHIWRYISKPWEPEDLIQTLHQAVERTRMSLSLEKSKKELEKALNELRAKDWARERLFYILLHEFRTVPQIIENLRTLNDDSNNENPQLRMQFLENLERRFSILENDIRLLLEDEKRFASLQKSPTSLAEIVRTLAQKHQLKLHTSLGEANTDAMLLSHPEMLYEALQHLLSVMESNNLDLKPELSLDESSGPGGLYFLNIKIQSSQGPILPKGLEKASLHPELAWTALLEPFVGLEDFKHHTTGLRIDTARWVRFLNSQGYRPEFQITGNSSCIELLISFKKPT
jgi:response regulator RpfG family c-di-GMP phosphodiesterase